MQGTWKEKISGWAKDNKRKKHTRKHTLKDKIKPFITNCYYKDNNRQKKIPLKIVKNRIIKTTKYSLKKSGFVEVWIIKKVNKLGSIMIFPYLKPIIANNIRTAYLYNGIWYDEYTNNIIAADIIKKVSFLYKKEINFEPFNSLTKGYTDFSRFNYVKEYKIYIYDKPIPVKFWKLYGFYSSKRRIFYQKLANSKSRHNVKEWIRNGYWDEHLDIDPIEKSISWEIN